MRNAAILFQGNFTVKLIIMENSGTPHENSDQLRRSQNGTQWGSDRNGHHDDDQNQSDDQGIIDQDPDPKQDWGEVDPQAGSYDPDTDPSGPGSAV